MPVPKSAETYWNSTWKICNTAHMEGRSNGYFLFHNFWGLQMLSDLHRRQIYSGEWWLGVSFHQIFVHFVPRRRRWWDTFSANQNTGISCSYGFSDSMHPLNLRELVRPGTTVRRYCRSPWWPHISISIRRGGVRVQPTAAQCTYISGDSRVPCTTAECVWAWAWGLG